MDFDLSAFSQISSAVDELKNKYRGYVRGGATIAGQEVTLSQAKKDTAKTEMNSDLTALKSLVDSVASL